MAAASGKQSSTSLSLFMETFASKWKKSSLLWLLRLGQEEFGSANGTENNKKRG